MESQQVIVDAPAAGTALAREQTQKLSLFALTMMVVGSMVGGGHLVVAAALRHRHRGFWRDHSLADRSRRHVYLGPRVPGARGA